MSTARSPRRRSCTGAWPHLAELAAELQDDVLERFLRYVRIDTTSDSDSETYPSTAKQRDLGELLARELRELGLEDVEFTEHGYVFATVPGSTGPTIGLIAHMDTSADESGTDVQPQVIRNYDGGDIVLPGDPRKVLRAGENPLLAEHAGHDIVTTDGTTLLGADDKAGVAIVMTMAEHRSWFSAPSHHIGTRIASYANTGRPIARRPLGPGSGEGPPTGTRRIARRIDRHGSRRPSKRTGSGYRA